MNRATDIRKKIESLRTLKMESTEKTIRDMVSKWRASNPNIKSFWDRVEGEIVPYYKK